MFSLDSEFVTLAESRSTLEEFQVRSFQTGPSLNLVFDTNQELNLNDIETSFWDELGLCPIMILVRFSCVI